MYRLVSLFMILLLASVSVASAVDNLGSTLPAKGSFVGDNMGDGREGGENFGSALAITALPFSDSGATCDNVNDITLPCASSAAQDVVYRFTAPANMQIDVSLCGSGYDTALGIYDQSQANIACNDDFCGLQSEIDGIYLTAGQTYYIVVDGYSTSCGSYVISVVESPPPCDLECPNGALVEGEPDCYDGYVDMFNSGCNGAGYQPIVPQANNAAVLCGKSGVFDGGSSRDTDWFLCYGTGANMTATCTAEFPLQLIFIYGLDCNNLLYDITTSADCVSSSLTRYVAAGTPVWIWVGSSEFSTSWPCGLEYVLEMSGIGVPPTATETTSWSSVKSLY